MRFFDKPFRATFLKRPNRFLVRCKTNGKILSAFLPNPGRLNELLLPGSTVHLVRETPVGVRKYEYTAVAVEREGHPIMLHTHRNNDVARYLLREKRIPGLEHASIVRSEIQVGRSRFDFLLEEEKRKIILEVKSCTLVGRNVAMFPDAITDRGARHLRELAHLSGSGQRTAVLFIVHWPYANVFMPDYHTDLHFSQTLLQVRWSVQIIPIAVRWSRELALLPGVKLLQVPWDHIEQEAKDRGSYLLILELKNHTRIPVGSLGEVFFKKGFYLYVGSAMANLSRRMERHRHLRKKHHWHIDALRAVTEFHSILAIRSSTRLECDIASSLPRLADWSVRGFGCSDCTCETHLFGMRNDPLNSAGFHQLLQYFRMDRYEEACRNPRSGLRD